MTEINGAQTVEPRLSFIWRPDNFYPASKGHKFVLRIDEDVEIPICLRLIKLREDKRYKATFKAAHFQARLELVLLQPPSSFVRERIKSIGWRATDVSKYNNDVYPRCKMEFPKTDTEDTLVFVYGVEVSVSYVCLKEHTGMGEKFFIEFDVILKDDDKKTVDEDSIGQSFQDLYTSKCMTDVALICEDTKVYCHKAVLAARSPEFKARIMTAMHNQVGVSLIEINDMTLEELNVMVEFIYTGKVEDLQQYARNLLGLSDKYGLKLLHQQCLKILMDDLDLGNVIDLLGVANACNNVELKASAMTLVKENKSSFKDNEAFKKLLLKSPALATEFLMSLM